MKDLSIKIKELIEKETEKGCFEVLSENKEESSNLIQQIIKYELLSDVNQESENMLQKSSNDSKKRAELVFVAAPTGAGKDTLVARLCYKNPEKNYIELNMDRFRQYFGQFIKDRSSLTDKNFAKMTNEFSYEIYVTIQEILLQEFPGTNIIITGTLRDIDWVEKTFERFKNDEKTDYEITLACLAVPKKESAISVIKRYIGIVKGFENSKLLEFYLGTIRYTSLEYHDETFEKFPKSLEYFEKSSNLIDKIEVYKRGENMLNLEEETKVYSSKDNENITALEVVNNLREQKYQVPYIEVDELAHIILENKEYLKSQHTLSEVIRDLAVILEYPHIVNKIDEIKNNDDYEK